MRLRQLEGARLVQIGTERRSACSNQSSYDACEIGGGPTDVPVSCRRALSFSRGWHIRESNLMCRNYMRVLSVIKSIYSSCRSH